MAPSNEALSVDQLPGLTFFKDHPTAEELAQKYAAEIKGKNVVITGISIGSLGYEALRVIAPFANKIWAIGRSAERTHAAIEEVLKEAPGAKIEALHADLGDIQSVKVAAKHILSSGEPIHILINNAMVGVSAGKYWTTKDGFEANFGANHLGHFVLVGELLPGFKAAAKEGSFKPRVVAVSSTGHRLSAIRFDDPNFEKRPEEFSMMPAYGQSKTANILFARQFAKKFKSENLLAYSLHPGGILTPGAKSVPEEEYKAMGLMNADGTWNADKIKFKTLAQGAATHIAAAFDPSIIEQSGAYLDDTVIHNDRLAPHADDDDLADKLWQLSEKLTGVAY